MSDFLNITIGEGKLPATHVKVFKIEGNKVLYESDVSYTAHDLYLGFSLTIFKNTNEGELLKNLIGVEMGYQYILDYLDSLILKNVTLDHYKAAICKLLNVNQS
jgi:hypothetical protein